MWDVIPDLTNVHSPGQSAGAGIIDIMNFAYPDDPIYQGIACDSGSAFLTSGTRSNSTSSFDEIAATFGCNSADAEAQLECMRAVPGDNITAYLFTSASAHLTFAPFIDDTLIFNNYTDRLVQGAVSDIPAIYGSNSDGGMFGCDIPILSGRRQDIGLTTFRYLYSGNFSNVSPYADLGAFHGAEIPLITGTMDDFYGPNTPFEIAVSQTMQDLWVAFANDPGQGLISGGWLPTDSGELINFAANNVTAHMVPVTPYDTGC